MDYLSIQLLEHGYCVHSEYTPYPEFILSMSDAPGFDERLMLDDIHETGSHTFTVADITLLITPFIPHTLH